MADIATFIGALVPTFFLSRIMLRVMKSWDGGMRRLVVAHAVALLIVSFLGGMGFANGGAFAGWEAMAVYGFPQFLWFALDYFRYRSGKPALASGIAADSHQSK